MERPLLIAAQASDPKGVTIWRTIRQYLTANGLAADYALFSSYEAMDRALMRGEIDIAWNAPMAQAQTILQSGGACRVLAMRDTDKEVTALLLVKSDSGIASPGDLRGKRVALGSATSSEQALIPKRQLRQEGLDLDRDCTVVELEPTEHPGEAAWVEPRTLIAALEDGKVDAITLFKPWYDHYAGRKRIDPDVFREIWRSRPFSHCGFAARPGLPEDVGRRFVELMAAMDYGQPDIKEMMDLEYLRAWVPADESGWQDLVAAVKEEGLAGKIY
jgi:ABC-type phosphate/phosphonate transport system substrate-binding protein